VTPTPSYRELDGTQIVATVRRLEQRIGERFPAAGLRGDAAQLVAAAEAALTRAPALRRPLLALRSRRRARPRNGSTCRAAGHTSLRSGS